ncbi:hypothetical protein Pan258_29210 [Symmachiella dynata]|uniref:Uncharacterized protein n=1 Tax=Symmachiella dynata TaxID=2527995 RepID=A0A517ZPY4_9PLAN|nr:hypothetical protein Pan258_29210 [Symmachiella dynata]QDU44503.1 hypothetical protein Mal52_29860 [Symmachiella dynata]
MGVGLLFCRCCFVKNDMAVCALTTVLVRNRDSLSGWSGLCTGTVQTQVHGLWPAALFPRTSIPSSVGEVKIDGCYAPQ